MERYEVPIDATLAPLVEALERGDEVVLTRDGEAVAELSALHRSEAAPGAVVMADIREMMDRFREVRGGIRLDDLDAAALVREMRDEDP